MTGVAVEVDGGVRVHRFCTPRSLLEVTLPALARGRARSALPDRIKLSLPVMIVTGMSEVAFDAALQAVRTQIAFYASTPAYTVVLADHHMGDPHPHRPEVPRTEAWGAAGARGRDG